MITLKCLRCHQDSPAIQEKNPYPGALGKMVSENICQLCWEAWRKFSVNVINDYKLRPYLPLFLFSPIIVRPVKKNDHFLPLFDFLLSCLFGFRFGGGIARFFAARMNSRKSG